MKIEIRTPGVCNYVIFCISFLFCAGFVFAQSGKSETEAPVKEITAPAESKPKEDIPAPKSNYEYIPPQNIYKFMITLKDAGKRGFRLDKMTTLPSEGAATSAEKVHGTVLSGVVKFDGESRYDYTFFFAEKEKDPEITLNDLAKEGWALRDLITVTGALDISGWSTISELPTLGNIYLLERTDGKKTARTYKLLKAGVGTGRNPSAKLQGLLDQSLTEGYVPVGSYTSFNIKNILSVDSFSGILLEKRDEPKKIEYKFVRGNTSKGLWEDLDVMAKQGFRIDSIGFATAIMAREPGTTTPVSYTWLVTEDKKFQTELPAALAKNPALYSTGVYAYSIGSDMNKNLLIFENSPAAAAPELKLVKIIPLVPKQFKKNPQEFLKTVDKPEVAFQKAMDEGYNPRDIYFSDSEGLVMIFTREKKQ